MIHHLLELLAQQIIAIEEAMGLGGVVFLMAIESACIPLPSEIIMPFAGYLVGRGTLTAIGGVWGGLWGAGIAGAVGCVLGSWIAYFIGMYGGRPFAEKYGKFILLNPNDLKTADRLFSKYGEVITFFSRLLPVIRTFIAFPAGVSRMNLSRFTLYTFFGSLPWCLGLAWAGDKLGENWMSLRDRFHQIDLVIAICIIIGGIYWVRHHLQYLVAVKKRP